MKTYFAGKECKNGHICENYTSGRQCIICHGSYGESYYNKHKQEKLHYEKITRKQMKDIKKTIEFNIEPPKVTTRKAAAEKGLTTYLTGHPCPNGHNAERYTITARCIICSKEDYKARKVVDADKIKQRRTKYRAKNAGKIAYHDRVRKGMQRKAKPIWYEDNDVNLLYEEAKNLSKEGMKYVVDHIIPIMHPLVCGLHCLANLRVLSFHENAVKGNTFDSDDPVFYHPHHYVFQIE